MSSKQVTRSSQLAAELASAAVSWSSSVREAIEVRLRPYLREGESMPDIALLQELLGRLMADEGKRLTSGDNELALREHHARRLRRLRDQQAAVLRQHLLIARFYLDRVGGRGSGAKYGLGHGLAKMGVAELERLGRSTAALLPRLDLPPDPGLADPVALTEQIGAAAAELRRRLEELVPEKSGAVAARGSRDRGLFSTVEAVRRSAGLLAELYKFAGHKRLARAIRPAFKPRRSRAKPGGAPAAPPPGAVTPAAVPPAETGPAETGPAETGPAELRPAAAPPTERPAAETSTPDAEPLPPLLEGLDWSEVRRVEVEDAENEASAAGRRRWRSPRRT